MKDRMLALIMTHKVAETTVFCFGSTTSGEGAKLLPNMYGCTIILSL